jgi:hypothetical protein
MYRVYQALNIVNGKKYIGKESGKLFSRKESHIYMSISYDSQLYFHRAIRKHGLDVFIWSIISHHNTDKEALDAEKEEIGKSIKNGEILYNMTWGGEGSVLWTNESILLDALQYQTANEWQKKGKASYISACRKGILKECQTHMNRMYNIWTLEKCLKSARRFSCTSDWAKEDNKAYDASIYHGWLDKCKEHMTQKVRGAITVEYALNVAKNFETIKDFSKADGSCYRTLLQNNCLHLANFKKFEFKTKYHNGVFCSNGDIYKSPRHASETLKIDYSGVCKSIRCGTETSGFKFWI